MKPDWALIVNCGAGRKTSQKKWAYIQQLLQQYAINYTPFYTQKVGHAHQYAMDAIRQGYRYLLVMGGDGTISEVVDGVMKSGVDTTQVTLALLPAGTGNDWARYWGIRKIERAIQVAAQAKSVLVDVGKVTLNTPQPTVRYFINAFGFGFDARVIQLTNKLQRRFKGSSWTYVVSLFAALVKHRSQPMHVVSAPWTESFNCYTVSMGNGTFTGGGIRQTPLAVPTDGWLDVMAMGELSFFKILKAIPLLFTGRLLQHPSVRNRRIAHIQVQSEKDIVSEIDGILQPLVRSFTVDIVPQALRFVCS
jgi:diacylglycerol kinase (ATP)